MQESVIFGPSMPVTCMYNVSLVKIAITICAAYLCFNLRNAAYKKCIIKMSDTTNAMKCFLSSSALSQHVHGLH